MITDIERKKQEALDKFERDTSNFYLGSRAILIEKMYLKHKLHEYDELLEEVNNGKDINIIMYRRTKALETLEDIESGTLAEMFEREIQKEVQRTVIKFLYDASLEASASRKKKFLFWGGK